MTCEKALSLVEKLADGEATPHERAEAEAHIDSCEDCHSHYQFVHALESASEAINWHEPPESYWQHLPSKVLARLDREPERKGFWGMLFAPAVLRFGAVAATLTVVVAVGLTVLRDDPAQLEPQLAQSPASGKRQDDEKSVIAEESLAEPERALGAQPEPERQLGLAGRPSPSAGVASTPNEPARRQRLEAPPAQSVPAAPALQAAEAVPADLEGEIEEVEQAWEVTNPAGLEGGVVAPAEPAEDPPAARQNRLRSFAESADVAGESRRARDADEQYEQDELARDPGLSAAKLSRASGVDVCAGWRRYLEQNGDEGSESIEARYQVAVCSFGELDVIPSAEARERASEDAAAFLALESEGERAEEIRARSERLNR